MKQHRIDVGRPFEPNSVPQVVNRCLPQYNYFLSRVRMTYYTLLPNYYSPSLNPSYMTYPSITHKTHQNVSETSSLISYLSDALKKSVLQFSLSQPLSNAPTVSSQPQEPIKKVEKIQVRVTETTKEEKVEKVQNSNKREEKIIQEIVAVSKKAPDSQHQNSSQHITSDQNRCEIVDVPLKSLVTPLTVSQPSKKDKNRHKKSHHHVRVPKVDLIQTAVLPQRGIEQEELTRKREALLTRRVDEWDERIKNRRDKREIRMLTN